MPITLTRPNGDAQRARYPDDRLPRVAEEAATFLSCWSSYGFTADELAARLDVAAPAAVIEHALSLHGEDEVSYGFHNDTLYWFVTE